MQTPQESSTLTYKKPPNPLRQGPLGRDPAAKAGDRAAPLTRAGLGSGVLPQLTHLAGSAVGARPGSAQRPTENPLRRDLSAGARPRPAPQPFSGRPSVGTSCFGRAWERTACVPGGTPAHRLGGGTAERLLHQCPYRGPASGDPLQTVVPSTRSPCLLHTSPPCCFSHLGCSLQAFADANLPARPNASYSRSIF